MAKIIVRIPKNGRPPAIEVDGVTGPLCLKMTEKLRERLAGGKLQRKPEFDDRERLVERF